MFAEIDTWILWGIIAVICFMLEMFFPSFWIAILGIGAIAASLASFLGAGTIFQIAALSLTSIVCGLFLRPLAMKYIYRKENDIPTNTAALIGKKVQVLKEISVSGNGRVKIGGETWKAIPDVEGSVFKEGDIVTVKKVDGAKVIVYKEDDDCIE